MSGPLKEQTNIQSQGSDDRTPAIQSPAARAAFCGSVLVSDEDLKALLSDFAPTDQFIASVRSVIDKLPKAINLRAAGIKKIAREVYKSQKDVRNQEEALGKASVLIDAKKKELLIPYNLEEYADDAILLPAVTFMSMIPDWTIESGPGTFRPVTKEDFKVFISGYFTELGAPNRVTQISFAKGKPFQQGRACARYEVLKHLVPERYHKYFTNIPDGMVAKDKKTRGRLETAVISAYDESDRGAIYALLKDLAKVSASQPFSLRKFDFSKFFVGFEALIAMNKRHKTVEEGKGKSKVLKSISITCTKPDALAGVIPCEKDSVGELFNSPWDDLKHLEDLYKFTKVLSNSSASDEKNETVDVLPDFKAIEDGIKNQINAQWTAKTHVQKHITKRGIAVQKDGKTDLNESIKATKASVAKIDTIGKYCKYIFDNEAGLPSWLPMMMEVEGEQLPLDEAVKKYPRKFPATLKLLAHLEDYRVKQEAEKAIAEAKKRQREADEALKDD